MSFKTPKLHFGIFMSGSSCFLLRLALKMRPMVEPASESFASSEVEDMLPVCCEVAERSVYAYPHEQVTIDGSSTCHRAASTVMPTRLASRAFVK